MRFSRTSLFGCTIGCSLLAHAQAWAAPCQLARPHVDVVFSENWEEEAEDAVLSDLSAALKPQSMSACRSQGDASKGAVSLVSVRLLGNLVTIEVNDSLTNKKVSRDVTLRDSADDSSPLVVAVAIDELLRATWAELSLRKTEGPAELQDDTKVEPISESNSEPPAPKTGPVEEPDPRPVESKPLRDAPARLPLHRVALRGAVDAYVVGSTFWGGDVTYGSSWRGAVEWTAFAGPRLVRSSGSTTLGLVRADAVSFGAELSLPVVATKRFFFGPRVSLAATHAWFRGEAEAGSLAEGGSHSGWAWVGRAGFFGRLHFGGAYVALSSQVGAPFVGLEITDGSDPVGGMRGLEWSNTLSLGWWFQ